MQEEEPPEFLRILRERDPEYAGNVLENYGKNFSDGALPAKFKALIAMSLDAGRGHPEGVRAISRMARELGATEEEILEAVEVVEGVCGLQGLAAAAEALKE